MTLHTDKRPIYLAIIWHHHQPLYVDSQHDCLIAPWVRTHGTKDYYDMAAMLEQFPNVHCTINLSTSLLKQLQNYYLARLEKCVDLRSGSVNIGRFKQFAEGRIDPWIDLLMKPAEDFDEADRDYLYRNPWGAVSINEVLAERFPEYERLKFLFREGDGGGANAQQLRELKFWFHLAYFDPDFLTGAVTLPSGSVCDLSDLLRKHDGKYYLRRPVTEQDCHRLLVEIYKVFSNIIPVHRRLQYHPETFEGQIELVTTPYTHPILPLLYDSDVARICQPEDPLPPRFSYPEDVDMHIKKAIVYYKRLFGSLPTGMWPAEGGVSQEIVPLFARNGIRWIATDKQILDRSRPHGQSHLFPYRLPAKWSDVVILFRDTYLSDKVGFAYQTMRPEEASDDFIKTVFHLASHGNERDHLLTVILDGENAWEWYRFDHDAKHFLHALYRKLERLYATREIITVAPTEYLLGNEKRWISPHPPSSLPQLEWLWPGSWIHANFDTWIGEREENEAWSYLLQTRQNLDIAGVGPPDPSAEEPSPATRDWHQYHLWEAMYAAEGSDWFWWYGEDQNAPGGDKPFDVAFLTHLHNVYHHARKSGAKIQEPEFKEIIGEKSRHAEPRQRVSAGAMTRGMKNLVPVLFRCRVPHGTQPTAVYIVGNREELGEWVPNRVRLHDDGTNGDEQAGDGVWSLLIDLPVNAEIHYKYTHSGVEGQWEPGDERAGWHRTLIVTQRDPLLVDDVFGVIDSQD